MIIGLPYGYDTLLDREFKNGQDLSGGQWQRLVAARGLYRELFDLQAAGYLAEAADGPA
ncbi:hypothetical protein [Micromonospora rhizosphaerae]|uniref:hypothetical protein n=1 Tax=Micromonospora rhizosphaerae TaxID=568872 RepID=UPI000AA54983|nr:hypothetical protein [Micromonospora rhizosphaerae]